MNLALALAALLAIQGCSSTSVLPEPPRVSEEDVVGKWTGKISLSEAASNRAAEQTADDVAGKQALEMISKLQFPTELRPDKTFSLVMLFIEFTGTWSLDGEAVHVRFEGVNNEQVAKAMEQGGGLFGDREFVLTVSEDKMSMSGSPEGDPGTVFTFVKVVDEEEIDDEP